MSAAIVYSIVFTIIGIFAVCGSRSTFSFVLSATIVAITGHYAYHYRALDGVFDLFTTSPILALLSAVLYFVIGGAYVLFFRYGAFLSDHTDELEREISQTTRFDATDSKLHPSKNVDMILRWIAYWPINGAYQGIRRPVEYASRKTFNFVVNGLNRTIEEKVSSIRKEN